MGRKRGEKATNFGVKGMRLVRMWECLLLLGERREAQTAAEIHDRLARRYPFGQIELSLETTRNDLKLLRTCGFPVVAIGEDGEEVDLDQFESLRGRLKNIRWSLRDPARLPELVGDGGIRPSAADVLSLSLLRALLTHTTPGGFWLAEATKRLLDEVHTIFNGRLREGRTIGPDLSTRLRLVGARYIGEGVREETLRLVCGAIQRRQVLVGSYRNRDGDLGEVDVAPQAVWFSEGRTYTIAAGATDGKLRAWRLDRFVELSLAPHREQPPVSQEEVDAMLRTCFRGQTSEPRAVTLRVAPEAAHLFREYQYHPTQRTEPLPNGGLLVMLEAASGWALEEWILGFGELAEVVSPEDLRQRLAARLHSALQLYEPSLNPTKEKSR